MGKVIHMNKQAYERVVGSVLSKKAGVTSDILLGAVGGAPLGALEFVAPGLGNAASTVVGNAGGIAGASTPAGDIKDLDKNPALSLIPGVAAYRLQQRVQAAAKKYGDKSPRARTFSTMYGPATSTLLTALLGAGIGAGVGAFTGKPGAGALIGGGTGAGVASLANLLGTIGAGIMPRRTDEEQKATSGDTQKILNYTVPGVAAYDAWKTLGKSRDIK